MEAGEEGILCVVFIAVSPFLCVCVCVHACVYVCVCVCITVVVADCSVNCCNSKMLYASTICGKWVLKLPYKCP